MNPLSCLDTRLNIGKSSCKKLPQQIKGMITTPADFSIAEADVSTVSTWQDALIADEKRNRIYYWPTAVNMEQVSEENIREETSLSTMAVRDGRYRFRLMFQENLELHKAMFSHKNFDGRVFLVDNENKIIGTELSNGNFAGFTLDLLDPEKLNFNDGSVSSKSAVYISLEDNLELDKDGAMVQGDFLRELIRLTSADLEVQGTPTATEIVVTVESSLDNEPVLGLVLADFVLVDSSGVAQTIDSVTEGSDGTYTLTGTAFVSGTLNLAAPSSLSVVGFEGIPVSITI